MNGNAELKAKFENSCLILNGVIENQNAFEGIEFLNQLLEAPHLTIDCEGVLRINSIGVKAWMAFFSKIPNQKTFKKCSPAVVEQINLISNFLQGGRVESLFLPFLDEKNKKEFLKLFTVGQLESLGFEVEQSESPFGGVGVFDDLPEEYFAFLMRA